MSEWSARLGPGRLQWRRGGWVGTQLGGTLWMLLCAARLSAHDPLAAALVGLLFIVCTIAGIQLWGARFGVSPYAGVQSFIAILGAATAAILVLVHLRGLIPVLDSRFAAHPTLVYLVLLLFPVLSVAFWATNRPIGARS